MKTWEKFLSSQEDELGKEVVEKWLRPLKIVHFDAANLYLEAEDPFQASWFEEHIRPKLLGKLFNENGRLLKVHLQLHHLKKVPPKKEKKEWKPVLNIQSDAIDPQATFDLFIPAQKDHTTFELLKKNLEALDPFNPLFICTPPGAGKSHLLMAAAHFLREKGLSCFYVRAESFTEHLVAAIRNGNMQLFRKIYRNQDVLLIDDIEVLGGRAASQEELFHTFNTLHGLKKRLIFSASLLPRDLTNVEPRLTSRFEWGLVLSFHHLELSEMNILLEKRQKAFDFFLNVDVSHFLLSHFNSSPRALVKAFELLVLRAHQNQMRPQDLNLLKAQKILEILLEEEKKEKTTPHQILEKVASFYELKTDDLIGKSQRKEYMLARQVAMYLCRTLLKMPYTKIGTLFLRDHSTVMTSIKNIENIKKDSQNELSGSLKILSKLP